MCVELMVGAGFDLSIHLRTSKMTSQSTFNERHGSIYNYDFVQWDTASWFIYKSTVFIPLIAFSSYIFEVLTIKRDM